MIQRSRKQMRLLLDRCGKPCRTSSGEVTLYITRHQFAANAKSDGLTREEIAALMGHASIYTAGEHYGRKRRANAPSTGQDGDELERITLVSSHPRNLQAVKVIEQERQEQRRIQSKDGPGMGLHGESGGGWEVRRGCGGILARATAQANTATIGHRVSLADPERPLCHCSRTVPHWSAADARKPPSRASFSTAGVPR